MRVGIWVELSPGAAIRGEGLMELLRRFIEGTGGSSTRFEVVAPWWSADTIGCYLRDFSDESRARIALITPRRGPYLARRAIRRLRRPEPSPALLRRLAARARKAAAAIGRRFMTHVFRAPLAVLAVYAALLAMITLLEGTAFACWRLLRPAWNWLHEAALGAPHLLRAFKLRQNSWAPELIMTNELARMRSVALRKAKVDCWLVPVPSHSGASALPQPVVVIFPDFVFAEFVSGFDSVEIAHGKKSFDRMTARRTRFICFSRHVLERHAIGHFGIPRERVALIPHAPVDLRPLIGRAGGDVGGKSRARRRLVVMARSHLRRAAAELELLGEFHRRQIAPYLRSLDPSNHRYLFMSSQIRPHKNLGLLVRAVEYLVRRKHYDVKLITTGAFDLARMPAVRYVMEHGLQFDVLSVPRMPPAAHAAFYALAALTVHPSFFEGGFPFVFSESLSVGTPCLLARSAAVAEVFPGDGHADFVFDPSCTPETLGDLIQRSVENREALLARQLPVLEKMKERTWQHVAREYLEVCTAEAANAAGGRATGRSGRR